MLSLMPLHRCICHHLIAPRYHGSLTVCPCMTASANSATTSFQITLRPVKFSRSNPLVRLCWSEVAHHTMGKVKDHTQSPRDQLLASLRQGASSAHVPVEVYHSSLSLCVWSIVFTGASAYLWLTQLCCASHAFAWPATLHDSQSS